MLLMPDSTILLGCQTNVNPNGPMGVYGFIFCRLDQHGNILDTVTNQYSIYYKDYRYLMPPNNISADWNGARDLHLMPNNRVLLTGSVLNSGAVPFQTTFLFHYPSFTLDTTYGIGGMGQVWDEKVQIAERTAFAPDGSTYTISNYLYSDSLFAFIVKRKPNGMLDSSWQTNGAFKYVNQKGGQFQDIKVHTDGSLFISGLYKDNAQFIHAMLLKFTPTGTPDASFGLNGKAEASYVAKELILNSDGSTYLIGSSNFTQPTYTCYVVKFKPNGTRDSSYATDGMFVNQVPGFIADRLIKQPDNKLLLIGNMASGTDSAWIAIMRLLPNGTVDSTFGNFGLYQMHEKILPSNNIRYANQGLLQADGKLLLGGGTHTTNAPEMMVVRLLNSFIIPPPTKIETKNSNSFSFVVSPIPAGDVLQLRYSISKMDFLHCSIFDIKGRLLQTETLPGPTPGNYQHNIDINSLSAGMYVLKIQGAYGNETRLIIVE